MEEIKVGEYVRTKRGNIGKFKFYGIDDEDEKIVYFKNNKGTNCVDENEVTKHSFNIIDLIEVGDIICIKDSLYDNEYRAEVFADYDNMLCINNFEENEIIELMKNIQNEQIKLLSIVTKEQFKSIEYEV